MLSKRILVAAVVVLALVIAGLSLLTSRQQTTKLPDKSTWRPRDVQVSPPADFSLVEDNDSERQWRSSDGRMDILLTFYPLREGETFDTPVQDALQPAMPGAVIRMTSETSVAGRPAVRIVSAANEGLEGFMESLSYLVDVSQDSDAVLIVSLLSDGALSPGAMEDFERMVSSLSLPKGEGFKNSPALDFKKIF